MTATGVATVAPPTDGGWAPVVRALARMKRPVSAVDYPPSVYMIGEDEAATVAELE